MMNSLRAIIVDDESLASFVGDRMTEDYLAKRFGPRSPELFLYREENARQREFGERVHRAYTELNQLYESDKSDKTKRRRKDEIIDALMADVEFIRRPNNAFLIGFKTYNAGYDSFVALYEACGTDWPRFLSAIESLEEDDFGDELQEDLAPVLGPLVTRGCKTRVASQ